MMVDKSGMTFKFGIRYYLTIVTLIVFMVILPFVESEVCPPYFSAAVILFIGIPGLFFGLIPWFYRHRDAMELAVHNGDVETAKRLIRLCPDSKSWVWSYRRWADCAIRNDRPDIAALFVAAGLSPVDLLNERLGTVPAIHMAVFENKLASARYLLEIGADPNCSLGGIPPLSFAAGKGHLASVKLLVEHGADINSGTKHADGSFSTAAASARFFGHPEVAEWLVSRGARDDSPRLTIQTVDSAPVQLSS